METIEMKKIKIARFFFNNRFFFPKIFFNIIKNKQNIPGDFLL